VSVRARVDGSIFLITLDNPPVNGLSYAVRIELCVLLENARQSPDISAVVIHGAGRCFSAGGDIREIGTTVGMAAPGLSSHVHPAIERCGKPVIAALHGLAFGGGLETALACNYRIACADTRIALPEVGLGIIPLSATQRLPRLIGLRGALEMIVGGREHVAVDLRSSGLFDFVLDDSTVLGHSPVLEHSSVRDTSTALIDSSLRFAREVLARPGPHPLVRHQILREPDPEAIIQAWRARLEEDGASEAQRAALAAVAATFQQPDFDAGLDRARAIYDELYSSPAAAAARDAFLAKRNRVK
jgi:enoyl-CoA hydratase